MAEVLQSEHKQKTGVRKLKKTFLRVDLTPMVDLGFLLISFFIFTTTLSQPTVMKLVMPDDGDSSQAAETKTLNLILGADDNTYIYNGQQLNKIRNIGSNSAVIRNALLQKKKAIQYQYGSDSDMIVLIKPTDASTYKNVVNALDEMLICNIKTYVLMDANTDESNAMKP